MDEPYECPDCENIWFEACPRCGQMHCLAWPYTCDMGGVCP